MALILILIQSSYDFAGWFIWLGEKHSDIMDYTWREWLFRVTKLILDFPVTIYLCLTLDIGYTTLIAFYIFKWFGGCDFFYLVMRMLWTKEKLFNYADWLSWTPYGLWEYLRGCKIISNHEFLVQVGIGFLITIILLT